MQPETRIENYYRVEYITRSGDARSTEQSILVKVVDGNLGDAYKGAREYLIQETGSIGKEITGIFKTEIEIEDVVVNGEYSRETTTGTVVE